MKIPKYIDELITRRAKLAERLASASSALDDWLDKKGIPKGDDYTCTGCMIYCEPYTAAELVRRDIIDFKEDAK